MIVLHLATLSYMLIHIYIYFFISKLFNFHDANGNLFYIIIHINFFSEPSAFQLIVQFVQQAETERVALAHNAQDPTAVLQTGSTSLALSEFEQFATSHASSIDSNQSDVKVDSEGIFVQ